jgi:hypothetical protein
MNENEFIHDLSNPLSAALFWIELMQQPNSTIVSQDGVAKVYRLLLEMRKTLENRRQQLKARAQETPAA